MKPSAKSSLLKAVETTFENYKKYCQLIIEILEDVIKKASKKITTLIKMQLNVIK